MKFSLLKKSRWIHKYFGLALLLFLAWMSISGILLNHPNLIKKISVPAFLIPNDYIPENWNRSTLKNIVYTNELKQDSLLLYGNEGIFIAPREGSPILPFMQGEFPKAARLKRSNHIWTDTINKRFLAATNDGLFVCEATKREWKKVVLPDKNTGILKILPVAGKIVLVSSSAFYLSDYEKELRFEKHIPPKHSEKEEYVSLVTVFFALHDGSIWGLPGKLLWDLGGIVLFFLCLSAFYIWFYPKKWKRNYKKKKVKASKTEKSKHKFYFKYHKKLGWYFAILLLIIFITGMFMRPPLIMALFKSKINEKWYPAVKNPNPWHHKIRNALYDKQSGNFVLDCSDGIWSGNLEKNSIFEKQKIPLAVFAMGATVFEEEKTGAWLVGSFGGLQRYFPETEKAEKLLEIKPPKQKGMPGNLLVTGYVKAPDGKHYALGHYKGLCDLKGNPQADVLKMPEMIREEYKMPLWNFLFELHNARIFKSVIGSFYILIIPLGGLLSVLIILSGIFDYFKKK